VNEHELTIDGGDPTRYRYAVTVPDAALTELTKDDFGACRDQTPIDRDPVDVHGCGSCRARRAACDPELPAPIHA
jgi:hypothetical protein